MSDAFVVRYDADAATGPGNRELPPHVDESVLSATIMLNDQVCVILLLIILSYYY